MAAESPRPRESWDAGNQALLLRRFALEAWLDAHSTARVRLVTGPAGCGKSTALHLWESERPAVQAIWIALTAGCSPETLLSDIIASVFANAVGGTARGRLVAIIDGIDEVPAETHDVLRRLVFRLPPEVQLIYVARSPSAIDLSDAERHGLVASAPPALLTIDAAEVAGWCERSGVAATAADSAALSEATKGNAAAITSVIRVAAEQALSLAEAAARRHVTPAHEPASPMRVAATSRGRVRARPAIEPAIVEMFGRFRMRFGAREVQFVRRRDRQIVQYLALRPGGKASRAQLMAEFWPDTDRRDAARRLRTACSTIRRAISACIGDDALDAYFRAEGPLVVLCPENVINEADAFEEHIEYARSAGERGDLAVARRHVAAALRLHDRPLLSGEPPAPWIVERARRFEELAAGARAFLFGDLEGTRIA